MILHPKRATASEGARVLPGVLGASTTTGSSSTVSCMVCVYRLYATAHATSKPGEVLVVRSGSSVAREGLNLLQFARG